MRTNAQKKQIHVAYFLVSYPTLTKTFIDREIQTLQEMGVDVRVFSFQRSKGPLSPAQELIARKITYLFPARWTTHLAAHLRFGLLQPRRYLGTLVYLLTRPHPTFKSHWRTLNHFHQGVYTAHLLRHSPVDHLHAHFVNHSATIALIASRLLHLPYSVTVHASSELFAKPMMVREKLGEAKFIATCTAYNQKYLSKMGKDFYDHKVLLVYHGLDAGRFQRKQTNPNTRPVILSVGQLRERKGFPFLIEACRLLKDRGADFECRIVGEGPLRAELEEQIMRYGMANRIKLCGALAEDEVINQYEQASIFALPAVVGKDGDRDGIPNVILEAMAMELPIVSTLHSGIPEVVEDGSNGLLVPPENSAALADAIYKLIENPNLRKGMGKQGRQTVLVKFNPERNAQILLEGFMPYANAGDGIKR